MKEIDSIAPLLSSALQDSEELKQKLLLLVKEIDRCALVSITNRVHDQVYEASVSLHNVPMMLTYAFNAIAPDPQPIRRLK